ncbi:hypothetical protein SDC9_90147 [bioreactor metagenome]|uniref:Uncharacterized protein n=1 Tax=bioreactor metagenome TaxID=1076179 RepID=A0A644ZXV8_9ZZZZ
MPVGDEFAVCGEVDEAVALLLRLFRGSPQKDAGILAALDQLENQRLGNVPDAYINSEIKIGLVGFDRRKRLAFRCHSPEVAHTHTAGDLTPLPDRLQFPVLRMEGAPVVRVRGNPAENRPDAAGEVDGHLARAHRPLVQRQKMLPRLLLHRLVGLRRVPRLLELVPRIDAREDRIEAVAGALFLVERLDDLAQLYL